MDTESGGVDRDEWNEFGPAKAVIEAYQALGFPSQSLLRALEPDSRISMQQAAFWSAVASDSATAAQSWTVHLACGVLRSARKTGNAEAEHRLLPSLVALIAAQIEMRTATLKDVAQCLSAISDSPDLSPNLATLRKSLRSELLIPLMLQASIETSTTFIRSLSKLKEHSLVTDIYSAMAAASNEMAALVFHSNPISARDFLKLLRQDGANSLRSDILLGLSAQIDVFTASLSTLTPYELMLVLKELGPESKPLIMAQLVRTSWPPVRYASLDSLKGSGGLAEQLAMTGQTELSERLERLLVERKNPADFPPDEWGGIVDFSRMIKHAPESNRSEIQDFLRLLATDQWLYESYSRNSLAVLIDVLDSMAVNLGADGLTLIWHPLLRKKVRSAIAAIGEANDRELLTLVQLAGSSQFGGCTLPRIDLTKDLNRKIAGSYDSVSPKPDDRGVKYKQRLWWMGIRSLASVSRQSIHIPVEYIEKASLLWQSNIDGADDWRGSSENPSSRMHRLNLSMITWLRRCLVSGAALPESEPLWCLAGFPKVLPLFQSPP